MKCRCKEARLIVLTLELVILIVLASYSSASYSDMNNFSVESSLNKSLMLTKDVYPYGEEVLAYIANPEEVKEISITGEKESYMFVGTIKSPIRFNPQKPGNYTIIATLNDKTKLEKSFYVVPALKTDKEDVASVSTDKEEYILGETVIINLNFTKNESYSFSILSKDKVYNYIDISEGILRFIPEDEGRYYAQLSKGNETIGSIFFDVNKKEEKAEIIENIKTDKKEYLLGEQVDIYLTASITEFKIILGQESFNFMDVLKNTTFIPKKSGIYEIMALAKDGNETQTISYYFSVGDIKETQEEYDYIFNLNENAVMDFDFSEEVEKRRTLFDRILNIQLIEQVTSYVKDHSQDPDFSLNLERLDNNKFRVYVLNNENIKSGVYNLVVEAYIKGELVTKKTAFNWFSEEEKTENITKEKEIDLTEIKKYVPYYFDIDENPVFDADFNNKISKERNILDIALKRPNAEKISAYIYGEENNTDFVIHIEHLEYDKFKLSVDENRNIKPDVYKLIVIIKVGDEFFADQKLFSWGISNVSVLLERIKLKDKEISLDEIIKTTGINLTEEKAEDKPQSNENVSNITEEIQGSKEVTNRIETVSNLIIPEVNESVKLINLSNKLISERLVITSSNNKEFRFELKLNKEETKIIREVKEGKIFGIFKTSVEEEKEVNEYDVEINPENHPLKKIHFSDLKIEENKQAKLKIDKLEKEKINLSVKKTMNSFAIDPTLLDFSKATMTLKAEGSELYKCKEWNFTEQKCYGSWKKIKDIIPGEEYRIELTKEDPAFTEIGLVTINTHKSIYLPNEGAFIGIGILDHEGKVVCDASVTLVITNPNREETILTTANGNINISSQCSLYGVTELPDYYTTYKVGGVGSYLMNITAVTYDGTPIMLDNFSVQSFVDFDVARDGPTRIFPPVPYTMNFTIKANKDYNGPITEIVPKDFAITSQQGLSVVETDENKILTWNKNLENGGTYSISYEFDAPDISPDLFYLGPLSIGAWYESRQWQIASDAQKTVIQDVGTFSIAGSNIEIGGTTTATADISTQNPSGAVDDGTWEIFIETDGDTRITASCQGGIPIKVISATGSGGSYSTYCTNNTPNSATITCTNVPKGTNLGIFTFTIEGCESGGDTYRLESTTITNSIDSFTGSDTLTVNSADSTPPNVILSTPSNNAWQTSRNVNFTYTPTTNDNYENCSVWTNESGWNSKQANKSGIINNSINWINETFDSDGYFLWNVECYDQNGNSNMSAANYTVKVDSSNPNVNLELPAPNYYDDTSDPATVIFNCSITDNMDSKNVSLYLTNGNNQSFSFNDSCTISGINGSCQWPKSLPNGNYIWNCFGYDESGRYDWSNNQTVKINSTFTLPQISVIQCKEQTEGWEDCSNIDFHEMLLAVRVNFTSGDVYITNVSFNFTNIPDDYNYFYSNSSYNDSGYWVFNNTDVIINDSGGFKLNIFSWDSSDSTDSSYAEWNIPWGSLSANLVNPTSDTAVNQNSFFTFTAEVSCSGGECGNVNATLDPNEGPSPASSCSGEWINCYDSYSDDGNLTIADDTDLEMQLYNFGFSVPATTIKGIEVIHDSYETGGTGKLNISLSWDGGISWTNKKIRQLTDVETTYNEGNAIDNWGRNWNSSEINSNNFRVRFESDGSGDEWKIEYIRVRIFYAVPVTTYYDPISDSQTGWTCTGGRCTLGHYAALNEGTRQPNAPNTTDYIYKVANVAGIDEHSIESISGTNISYVRLWAYVYTGSNCLLGISLQNDNSEVASRSINPGTGSSWININWTNPSNIGTVSAEFQTSKSGGGSTENCNVYAWYIEVLSENASQKSGAISTIVGDEPFYTTDSNPQDYNDQACLNGLVDGSSCQVSWNVNATGWLNTSHDFFVQFNMTSNQNYVNDDETNHIFINITQLASVPPTVTLESPNPGHITNVSTVIFNCSVTDIEGLKNMTLYGNFNGIFLSNGTNSISGTSNSTTFTRTLDDGSYTWNCRAYDTDGNDDWADSNRTLTIDSTKPYINLTGPDNDDTFYIGTINFNFTATDNIDSQMLCNLTINSTVRAPNFNANNGSITPKTISGLAQGYYLWNVTCIDDAGNINTSLTRNFTIIDLPPTVELITGDNIVQQLTSITLQYNASDNNNVTLAELYINGKMNDTNDSVQNNQINNFTVTGLGEGKYNWTVNVSDISGLWAKATEKYFTIDFTDPVIYLLGPQSPFSTSSSTIQFDYNVTDNLDGYLTCNITINGSIGDLNYNAQNSSNTSRTLYNIQDGVSYWNVTCYDDAGNFNISETRMINVSEPPTVSLNSPSPGHAQNSSSITFYYTPSDNSGFSECNLIINGVFNQTNSTFITNGAQNNFTLSNLGSGHYNWTVNCTDLIGLSTVASPIRNFTIDLEKPSITLYNPEPDETIYSINITFNYSVTDNLDLNLLCNLTVDGNIKLENIDSPNSSYVNRSFIMSSDGVHYWNITCTDDAGNTNISETRNFTSYSPPEVTLYNPAPNAILNYSDVTFRYTPYDPDGLANSSLIINDKFNQSNSTSLLNNESNYFYLTFETDGIYTWTVNATDTNGLEGTATPRTLTIDTTPPSVVIHHPYNTETIDWNNVTFNFTATDNLDNNIKCNITISDSVEYENIDAGNGSNTLRYKLMYDGSYNWSVKCIDDAGNINETVLTNFTVDAPPNVILNYPIRNQRTKSIDIIFNYTPIDAYGFDNCTLFFNGEENETKSSIQENVPNYFNNINGLIDGDYNWTVRCIDYIPDANEDTAPYENFTIDTVAPLIILNEPSPGESFNYNDIYFNWTATDTAGINITCNLSVSDSGGEKNENGIKRLSGSDFNATIDSLDYGIHYWNISCADDLGNFNISETRNFTINRSDLKITSVDIIFNDTYPVDGKNITINATIHNIGGVPANNFIVQFFDGDPGEGGSQINGNKTIASLDAGENTTINVNWTTSLGLHEIWVLVDSNNSVSELSETNNNASKNITISSWHIIYGQSSGNLVIEDLQNISIFGWYVNISDSGNIFAIDYDSSISWDNMTAVGIDLDGNQQMDDFEEIDTALGSTNFTDSVNRTFTSNGLPINKTSFNVFSNLIENVSVVNSTNNSNFVTGILWDSSDGGNEYNTSQDLIFITKINPNKQGAYGVYDYEIRIPSELKKYIATDQYSVALYVELR